MAEPQRQREKPKFVVDPFSQDPIRAIAIVRAQHKPLTLILRLDPDAVGNPEAHGRLEAALKPYGGILDTYTDFSSIVGYAMTDFDKANQLVRDQEAGKIPGVSHVSVDSMEVQACSNYEAAPAYRTLDEYLR